VRWEKNRKHYLFRLQPSGTYYVRRRVGSKTLPEASVRRLVKAPKLHLVDVGLACHMLGTDARRLNDDRSLLGPMLETFVVGELRKQISWSDPQTGSVWR
jgi:predicted AAA+ superfamily ATPase